MRARTCTSTGAFVKLFLFSLSVHTRLTRVRGNLAKVDSNCSFATVCLCSEHPNA
jgi:hypothetical protein